MKRFLLKTIFLLFVLVLTRIPLTGAHLVDRERLEQNSFIAGAIDLLVDSEEENFGPEADSLELGATVSREIVLSRSVKSLPLKHKVSYQFLDGQEDFCQQLNLQIFLGNELKYDGPLVDLVDFTDPSFIIAGADSQLFDYQITVPADLADDFQENQCRFKFVYLAWLADQTNPNGGFFDQEEIENFLATINWQRPTSEITSTEEMSNQSNFIIGYLASDNTEYVELWYSYNLGSWQQWPEVSYPDSPGSFEFTSPKGDGIYQFITVAVSSSGKVEDRDGNGMDDNEDLRSNPFGFWDRLEENGEFPYQVQVDTEAPYTVLSLGEFGDDEEDENRFAVNELMVNGNFEDDVDPTRGWVLGGAGEHRVVDDVELGGESDTKDGHSLLIGWFSDLSQEGVDYGYQLVSFPSERSTLSFWYQVISEDTVDYDWFEARIISDSDSTVFETIIRTGSDENDGWVADSGWREVTHSLAGWLGERVRVWFGVTNHDEEGLPARTFALIDDVRVTQGDHFVTPDKTIGIKGSDPGSGVDEVYYRINGGDWQLAEEEVVLSEEGVGDDETVVVDYFSVDLAGNSEEVQSLTLNTDEEKEYFGVVINQFMADPVGDDNQPMPGGEWVELYNNSEQEIDVGGWVLYDSNDSHELVITSSNTDTNNTLIPSQGKLRVYLNGEYSPGWLNNGTDTVRLYSDLIENGGELIDSFAYPETEEGKSWRRIPDGTGTWTDPEEEIEVDLTYLEGEVILEINYLPPDAEGEYEILYQSAGLEKGVLGKVSPEEIREGRVEKKEVLGSCSQGECVFDPIEEKRVTFYLRLNCLTEEMKREFSW